jgi:hypothetical protein
MSDELSDILDPDADAHQLAQTTCSLNKARPVPSPTFRGELGRLVRAVKLIRPVARWRVKALALAACGALLLGAAGAGVAGSGPLAPTHLTSAPVSSPGAR